MTQQLITENFMKLEAAQNDKDLVVFQRELFEEAAAKISRGVEEGEFREDVDLREHLDMLEEKHIRSSAGDWTA
mgnify:CR=1 FL=1